MKVIIIKDCKDGKVNDIVDVSDGYAKNFLIRNGYANPINSVTQGMRNKDVEAKKTAAALALSNALKAKTVIEQMKLDFSLKTTDLVVHGSITRKQIMHSLKEKGIHVDSHSVENVQIESLGITNVAIKLHKQVIANLRVEVHNG